MIDDDKEGQCRGISCNSLVYEYSDFIFMSYKLPTAFLVYLLTRIIGVLQVCLSISFFLYS